jgi:hypothetical protein
VTDYETLLAQIDVLIDAVAAQGAEVRGSGCTTGESPVADFSYTTAAGDIIDVEIRIVSQPDMEETLRMLHGIREQRDAYHAAMHAEAERGHDGTS